MMNMIVKVTLVIVEVTNSDESYSCDGLCHISTVPSHSGILGDSSKILNYPGGCHF